MLIQHSDDVLLYVDNIVVTIVTWLTLYILVWLHVKQHQHYNYNTLLNMDGVVNMTNIISTCTTW